MKNIQQVVIVGLMIFVALSVAENVSGHPRGAATCSEEAIIQHCRRQCEQEDADYLIPQLICFVDCQLGTTCQPTTDPPSDCEEPESDECFCEQNPSQCLYSPTDPPVKVHFFQLNKASGTPNLVDTWVGDGKFSNQQGTFDIEVTIVIDGQDGLGFSGNISFDLFSSYDPVAGTLTLNPSEEYSVAITATSLVIVGSFNQGGIAENDNFVLEIQKSSQGTLGNGFLKPYVIKVVLYRSPL